MMKVIYFVTLSLASLFSFSSSQTNSNVKLMPIDDEVIDEDPLILTPLIENGKISEAREKALVHHEEMKNVESYAGYLTINAQYNSNMFFWYFPAQQNTKDAPVILFLSGGPGARSVNAIFHGTGPFTITKNLTLETHKYSWNTHHHMIYVDNPIGAGYSFTDNDLGYINNQTQMAHDLLPVLLQFLQLFPELKPNKFYVSGESYGGKFTCSLSQAIKKHNDEGKPKINLAGIIIANGAIDPPYQLFYSDYWHQVGLIDLNGREQIKKVEEQVQRLVEQKKYVEAAMVHDKIILRFFTKGPSLFTNLTGYDNLVNYLQHRHPVNFEWTPKFATTPHLRKALHVGNVTLYGALDKLRQHLKSDLMQSVAPVLAELLRHYKVLFFNGQVDMLVPYPRTQETFWNLNWPDVEVYRKAERKQWWVDEDLAGYVKIAGNLTEVEVRNAGHILPYDQPFWAWHMLNQFTSSES